MTQSWRCKPPVRYNKFDVPIFMFQEGEDAHAGEIFAELAKVTKGAHAKFDANAAPTLGDLLKAVAVYATCGLKALTNQNSEAPGLLIGQLRH
jgi:hypothetical protein